VRFCCICSQQQLGTQLPRAYAANVRRRWRKLTCDRFRGIRLLTLSGGQPGPHLAVQRASLIRYAAALARGSEWFLMGALCWSLDHHWSHFES
jgi:hypothetical protein